MVGGGTGADIQYINPNPVPNASVPNNFLAPFWTDLNPGAAGKVRIGTLTDGVSSWLIVDYENMENFSDGVPNSFQVWIGVNGVQDINFVYGSVSGGDGGALTVGAENRFGSSGNAIYQDGADVVAGLEQVGGEAVPQGVAGDVLGDAGLEGRVADGSLEDGLVQVVSSGLAAGLVQVVAGRREDPLPRPLASGVRVLARQGVGGLDPAGVLGEVGLVQALDASN